MAGKNAFGTTFAREDDVTPGTYVVLANVTNITAPGVEKETIDVTAHDSVDAWMEFVGGLKDAGEAELEVNYDPALHDELYADFEVDDPINYQITWPGGAKLTFGAIMTGFETEAPVDDKLAATLTFKASGKPTQTAAV